MSKINNLKDIKEMIEKGISMEAIHEMHGDLIICPIDEQENLEKILNKFRLNDKGQVAAQA